MRNKLLLSFLLVLTFVLVGCGSKSKDFEKIGIKITLDTSFVEKEVIQFPLYLESTQHAVMGLRERISDATSVGIIDLEEYINAVLSTGGKSATVTKDDVEDMEYYYAFYESEVNDQTFSYMLVVLEGESYYYAITFGTLESKFEKSKDQYFDWVKTIVVE